MYTIVYNPLGDATSPIQARRAPLDHSKSTLATPLEGYWTVRYGIKKLEGDALKKVLETDIAGTSYT